MNFVKIGVAGPVGSGKTALIERLTRAMYGCYDIAVITNDIYTKEDAEFLTKNSKLPPERIIGVETGGCPHTAIREDASMNLEAVDEMAERFPDLQILFIESGGDNYKTFMLNLPAFHNRVMMMYPKLTPPEFKVTNVEEQSLHLHYFSKRNLMISKSSLPEVFPLTPLMLC